MSVKPGDPRTREALLAKIATYDGEALCPRCGNGFPVRADGPIDHYESCLNYTFAHEVCDACEKALGWEKLPKVDPRYRVLEGDWETVRDALDALPEGAQIRWQEGYPLHSFVGMKTTSVFGETRWSSVGSDGSFDHLSSAGIAHNDSPIEVIA